MMLDAPDRARRDDLPETLSDLLTARLDNLGPARLFMQVGAVIGREFAAPCWRRWSIEPEEALQRGARGDAPVGPGRAGAARRFVPLQTRADPGCGLRLDPRPRAARPARARRPLPDDRLRRRGGARAGNGGPAPDRRRQAARSRVMVARGGGAAIGRGSAEEAAALLSRARRACRGARRRGEAQGRTRAPGGARPRAHGDARSRQRGVRRGATARL